MSQRPRLLMYCGPVKPQHVAVEALSHLYPVAERESRELTVCQVNKWHLSLSAHIPLGFAYMASLNERRLESGLAMCPEEDVGLVKS